MNDQVKPAGILKTNKNYFILAVGVLMCQCANAVEPHISFIQKPSQMDTTIALFDGKSKKWEKKCSFPTACVIPATKSVLYTESVENNSNFPRPLVMRSFEGQQMWSSGDATLELGDYWDFVVGGGTALGTGDGPPFGAIDFDDIRHWVGYFDGYPVNLLNLKNGHVIWKSNAEAIGFPIWSNGKVFFSVKWSSRKGLKKDKSWVKVWLEERNVSSRKRVWRKEISGLPPKNVKVLSVGKSDAHFSFAGPNQFPDFDFAKHLTRLEVVAPLYGGAVPPLSLEARYYRGKVD